MPYIQNERKASLDLGNNIENPGELNYILSLVLIEYLNSHGLSYNTLNDISGAMTESLAEFRRRIVLPYEDKKIKENGDIYFQLDYQIQEQLHILRNN